MNDAISRSAAIADIVEMLDSGMMDELDIGYNSAVKIAVRRLRSIPALDVAPLVHARWNKEDGTCSACYHEAYYDEWTEPKWDYDWDECLVQTGEETHIQFIFSPYCPNCGARMDGEAE